MTNSQAVAGTTPYPWPFDGALVARRCALLICGSGSVWSALCPADETAEANIAVIRAAARNAGALVVLLRHRTKPRATASADVTTQPLTVEDGEREVLAAGIDGFYGSSLDADLRAAGRDQLLVIGHGLETTIHSTLRRANDRGYECLTVADASVAHDPALQTASVSTIEMSGGIFGAVGSTENVLQSLRTQPSQHSEPMEDPS